MEIFRFILDVALNMVLAFGGVLFGLHIGVTKERWRQRIKLTEKLREIITEFENTPLDGINDLIRRQIIMEYARRTMDFLKEDMVWEESIKAKKKLPEESLPPSTTTGSALGLKI